MKQGGHLQHILRIKLRPWEVERTHCGQNFVLGATGRSCRACENKEAKIREKDSKQIQFRFMLGHLNGETP